MAAPNGGRGAAAAVELRMMILKVLLLGTRKAKQVDWYARHALCQIARLESVEALSEEDAWRLRTPVLLLRAEIIRSCERDRHFSDSDLQIDMLEK